GPGAERATDGEEPAQAAGGAAGELVLGGAGGVEGREGLLLGEQLLVGEGVLVRGDVLGPLLLAHLRSVPADDSASLGSPLGPSVPVSPLVGAESAGSGNRYQRPSSTVVSVPTVTTR